MEITVGGRKNADITLGVLIDWTVESYQQTFLSGVFDYVSQNNLACVCFEGGAIGSPLEYESQRNIVYSLPGKENVAGLIILSATISHFSGKDMLEAFIRTFHPLPVVSVALDIAGIPSVAVDNTAGLRELIVHLIEQHGARRFAFIKGPPDNLDASERYRTFSAALNEAGLTVDPRYVCEGQFIARSGAEAARRFQLAGLDGIDAIVAANDDMALGAIAELRAGSPEALARLIVTGFDDCDKAAYARPPLSTVRLPVHEQGFTSARLLHDRILGREVPPRTVLPTRAVFRESCHCRAQALPAARPVEAADDAAPDPVLNSFHALGGRDVVEKLTAIVARGLKDHEAQAFIAACDSVSGRPSVSGIDFSAFENLLFSFWSTGRRGDVRTVLPPQSEQACLRAIMALGKKLNEEERERVRGYHQETASLQLIREILGTFEIASQMGILSARLGEVGLSECSIALFHRDTRQAHILLEHRDGRRCDQPDAPPRLFPARQLVPDDYLVGPERRRVIVTALRDIGFAVFPFGTRHLRFIALLSDILGGALQAALIFDELQLQKNNISQNLATLRQVMAGFIQTMSLTVETRDPYTAGHQHRVSDLARSIAQELALSAQDIEGIRMAGIIHDIGKIYVPSEILNRSGPLDEIEFSMIRTHPQIAFDILKNVAFPWPIAEIVYQHHERINGSGYPKGIAGDAIRLEARILAVADVVEAMASHRPYRQALGIDQALEEIASHKGVLYDAEAVNCCLRLFRKKGYTFRR